MKYASATFWEGLAERGISTFAQSLVGAFAVGSSLFDLDWKGALGIAGRRGPGLGPEVVLPCPRRPTAQSRPLRPLRLTSTPLATSPDWPAEVAP